jgi:hypothetical protein
MKFCIVALTAALTLSACTYTSGKNVSADQARQFVVGQSTLTDVESKLGQPTNSRTNSDGTETLQYQYDYTHQDATNYIPIYGLLQAHVEQASNRTSFVFTPAGILQSYSAGTGSDTMSN